MARTRTGSFPIGFRRGGTWQKDLKALIQWAKANGFEGLDVGPLPPEDFKAITAAGLRIGTVDFEHDTRPLASPDAGKRRAAAQANAEYINAAAPLGAKLFFTVMIPEDAARTRRENHSYAVDGLGQLCAAIAPSGAKVVLEGWPGGPNACALACTPESCRALLKDVGSPALGINFDPSHLIRMGIDHVRFISEFAPHVYHVHGKDTELLDDDLYEYGRLQAAVFTKAHFCGEWAWRYCIPGHGCARWGKLLGVLKSAGYQGMVSVELEDENFNGTEEGEKRGLVAAKDFLASV
ncbi:MAG: sugar phosphate isomerase/epimerase family protein [Phycisphaerae bacterium]